MLDKATIETRIKLDKFKMRPYQHPLFDALENKKFKRAIAIWPRRAGKDLCAFNFVIREAFRKIGVYFIVYPTYSQGRKILWDSMTNDGIRFLDFMPPELVTSTNSTEMKIKLVNGSMIQVVGSDNYDCFDDKTEILTENGWKLFKDVLKNEKVASLVKGRLEYVVPTKHVQYDYDGQMYRGLNSSIDFLVTPNHRFWVRSSKGFYKFKKISDPTIRHDSIPSKSDWHGEDFDTFVFPVLSNEYVCGKGRVVKQEYNREMPTEQFMALLGIFLSEGSTYSDHKTYRVTIAQKKPKIRKEIEELLTSIGINYQFYDDKYTFEDKQLWSYFSQFGKQIDRFVPKEVKNLDKKYLSILFEWLIKGDGTFYANAISYWSISKRLIDDVQEIAIKIGLSGNVSIKKQKNSLIRGRVVVPRNVLYQFSSRISSFKRLYSSKKQYITTEDYKGIVYCVSVPSGVIKVRRNGKECWSGNSLVGTNPVGIIFSEYALQDPRAYQFLRPVLTANDGWALFISTPRGKNSFWELYQIASHNRDQWFVSKLTVEDTGHISIADIERERQSGEMSDDLIMQEYYTSFDMGVEGAYYAKYIDKLKINGQIGQVPYESGFKVNTAWDIGVRDSTSIVFFQTVGQIVRIIDYYENSKQGLEHYVKILEQKDYVYGKHIAPHDIAVKEWGTGMTRIEKAKELGIRFTVAPNISIEDGIEAVRSAFSKLWIDESKCATLIKALENYRQEYDAKKKVYKNTQLHNWASNACDAVRYMCIALPKTRDGLSAEDLDKRYRDAMYGDRANMPSFFRDDNGQY